MKYLKVTTKWGVGRGAHRHVVYVNDDLKIAEVSSNDGHTHEMRWVEGMPAQVNELGNVISEAVPGVWEFIPGLDGHTHQVLDYERKSKKKKEDDQTIVAEATRLYKVALELESDSIEKAKESEDFYHGKQWDDDEVGTLEELDRTVLTINKCAKGIDELVGYQIEQRTDLHFIPQENGDARVADLLNVLSKHILDKCDYAREETKAFKDACITGRGNFNLYVDFNQDIQGQIRVERFPWKDVVFGPHEKEDLSDCEYLIKAKMFSAEKIKQLFPDKADDISKITDDSDEMRKLVYQDDDEYSRGSKGDLIYSGSGLPVVNIERKDVRVLEIWRKVYERAFIAANPTDNFYFNLRGWSSEDIESIKALTNFAVVSKSEARLRITKIAGTILLSDENPAELPVDDFFIVPLYAKKSGTKWYGKLECIKDPQREINKRHSHLIDILNKTASYGYFIDGNTFADGHEKEKFKRTSTQPGAVWELMDAGRPPKATEGVKFPTELVNLLSLEDQQIMDMMNITVEQGGANTSAAALLQRKELRLRGNEYLFDGLAFSKKKIGRLLIKLIQRYYSPERIVRIVNSEHARNPVQIGGQDLSQFSEEEILTLLETSDLEAYDVVISESAHTPTTRLSTFTMMQEMVQSGAPIPPEVIIELSPLPQEYKQKLLDGLAQQAQAQNEAAQVASQTEIDKTLIAQGVIPPDVQQRVGVSRPVTNIEGVGEGPPIQEQSSSIPTAQTPLPAPSSSNAGLGNEERMLLMTKMIVDSINSKQPAVTPININVDASRPKRQIGKIVRDASGNAAVEVAEVPEGIV